MNKILAKIVNSSGEILPSTSGDYIWKAPKIFYLNLKLVFNIFSFLSTK